MSTVRIKTWQEAFAKEGLDVNIMPDVSMLPEQYRKPIIAQYILCVVAKVLNEGWVPDYTDNSQCKYFPYFEVKATKKNPSGSGLSCHDYGCDYRNAAVGVRLCFKDWDTAEYAGKKFKKLYEDLYLLG